MKNKKWLEAKRRKLEKKKRKEAGKAKRERESQPANRSLTQYVEKTFAFEYHSLTFFRLHREVHERFGEEIREPPERKAFWQLIPPRKYSSSEAQEYIYLSLRSIEAAIEKIVRPHSIAYWYHVYRRLGLGSVGENKSIGTIYQLRSILDAAFQKFGRVELCDRIASSASVSIDEIFAGEPEGVERSYIEATLSRGSQLVLTQFTATELREFYVLERLAYEVWRAAALLRITGKGADIEVLDESPYIIDTRSDELDELVKIYDERSGYSARDGYWATHCGTVVVDEATDPVNLILCFINLTETVDTPAKHLLRSQLPKAQGMEIPSSFVSGTLNLRAFLEAHLPLSAEFNSMHGIPLEVCLVVMASVASIPILHALSYPRPKLNVALMLYRSERRGYLGVYTREQIVEYVSGTVPLYAKAIGWKNPVSNEEIEKVVEWLSVSDKAQEDIGLLYPGPHSMLIPMRKQKDAPLEYLIDYVWLIRRLMDFFFGIKVSDNSFKGTALERAVAETDMPLSSRQIFAEDGTSRQIDASFDAGERLFIAECRAWSRSIGYERGQPSAIRQRIDWMEKALRDIDDKARWLASHPKGHGYDVRRFKEIIPVGITLFEEFVPSLQEWYWLRPRIPRLLTVTEMKEEVRNSTHQETYWNTVKMEGE